MHLLHRQHPCFLRTSLDCIRIRFWLEMRMCLLQTLSCNHWFEMILLPTTVPISVPTTDDFPPLPAPRKDAAIHDGYGPEQKVSRLIRRIVNPNIFLKVEPTKIANYPRQPIFWMRVWKVHNRTSWEVHILNLVFSRPVCYKILLLISQALKSCTYDICLPRNQKCLPKLGRLKMFTVKLRRALRPPWLPNMRRMFLCNQPSLSIIKLEVYACFQKVKLEVYAPIAPGLCGACCSYFLDAHRYHGDYGGWYRDYGGWVWGVEWPKGALEPRVFT